MSHCHRIKGIRTRLLLPLAALLLTVGCAGPRAVSTSQPAGKLVCDAFLIYEMCVQDMTGDERVDLMYFSDSDEIFMYREGMERQVVTVLPLHPCAVPMSEDTVDLSTQLLYDEDLSLTGELDVKRRLLVNYMDARPAINNCLAENNIVEESAREPEIDYFSDDGFDWASE